MFKGVSVKILSTTSVNVNLSLNMIIVLLVSNMYADKNSFVDLDKIKSIFYLNILSV